MKLVASVHYLRPATSTIQTSVNGPYPTGLLGMQTSTAVTPSPGIRARMLHGQTRRPSRVVRFVDVYRRNNYRCISSPNVTGTDVYRYNEGLVCICNSQPSGLVPDVKYADVRIPNTSSHQSPDEIIAGNASVPSSISCPSRVAEQPASQASGAIPHSNDKTTHRSDADRAARRRSPASRSGPWGP